MTQHICQEQNCHSWHTVWPLLLIVANMPKASKKGGRTSSTPYSKSANVGAARLVNNVFKMNKDLGQHILKNPGVAQTIVDKAGLKQSDVRSS